MGVNSLPKTVTRQRRDCDLNPAGPSAFESSTLTTRLPSHPIGGRHGRIRERFLSLDLFSLAFKNIFLTLLRGGDRRYSPLWIYHCTGVAYVNNGAWTESAAARLSVSRLGRHEFVDDDAHIALLNSSAYNESRSF